MDRPGWWNYPEQCAHGHEWAPGLVTVSWTPCDCQPVRAAGKLGHLTVSCQAGGCRSRWYRPRHDPATATGTGYPARPAG